MNISENEFKEVSKIIKELWEDVQHLPDITKNVFNTNIHYRAYLLNQFVENKELIKESEIEWWNTDKCTI